MISWLQHKTNSDLDQIKLKKTTIKIFTRWQIQILNQDLQHLKELNNYCFKK